MESAPWDAGFVPVSVESGPLPACLSAFLQELPAECDEAPMELAELSLRFGRRLPDVAQTVTYWQRGDLGRTLRAAGFGVRVEYGRIIFIRQGAMRR